MANGDIKKIKVKDLIQDGENANKGNLVGGAMIKESIGVLGLGRSVLVDKDFNLIAGNKTQLGTLENGIEDAIVIDSDGTQLIVVRRTDLEASGDKGRALALADNRTAEVNLNWDQAKLEVHFDAAKVMGLETLVFNLGYDQVSDDEINDFFVDRDDKGGDDESDLEKFTIILNYTEEEYLKVKEALSKLTGTPEAILFDLLGLTDGE